MHLPVHSRLPLLILLCCNKIVLGWASCATKGVGALHTDTMRLTYCKLQGTHDKLVEGTAVINLHHAVIWESECWSCCRLRCFCDTSLRESSWSLFGSTSCAQICRHIWLLAQQPVSAVRTAAAKKYLSAPPSNVASEQLFSAVGHLYADWWNCLDGVNTQKLLLLVYNIRLFSFDY